MAYRFNNTYNKIFGTTLGNLGISGGPFGAYLNKNPLRHPANPVPLNNPYTNSRMGRYLTRPSSLQLADRRFNGSQYTKQAVHNGSWLKQAQAVLTDRAFFNNPHITPNIVAFELQRYRNYELADPDYYPYYHNPLGFNAPYPNAIYEANITPPYTDRACDRYKSCAPAYYTTRTERNAGNPFGNNNNVYGNGNSLGYNGYNNIRL